VRVSVLHGLLSRTDVRVVVRHFLKATLSCFHLLLRNHCFHTLTGVFDVNIDGSFNFSLDLDYVFVCFKKLYLLNDIVL
jgi:hypothetical protein